MKLAFNPYSPRPIYEIVSFSVNMWALYIDFLLNNQIVSGIKFY